MARCGVYNDAAFWATVSYICEGHCSSLLASTAVERCGIGWAAVLFPILDFGFWIEQSLLRKRFSIVPVPGFQEWG